MTERTTNATIKIQSLYRGSVARTSVASVSTTKFLNQVLALVIHRLPPPPPTLPSSIAQLYEHLNRTPNLIQLTNAFALAPEVTAAHIRNAGMKCLLIPRTAAIAFDQLQGAPTPPLSSLLERSASTAAAASLEKFATLIDFDVNHQIDQAAEIYSELTIYTGPNKSVSLIALHRALSHKNDHMQNKLKQAKMECLLSPKSATKAFSYLRVVQDKEKIGSLVSLENFRKLANFQNPPPPPPPPLQPPLEIFHALLQNTPTHFSRHNRNPTAVKVDTDSNNATPLSFSLWLSLLSNCPNIDRLRDTLKLAHLSALFVPSYAAAAFQEMTCMSTFQNRPTNIDDLRNLAQHGLVCTKAAKQLQHFAKFKVKDYSTRKTAALKIQNTYRWNFNLLPWSVASIRIQRQWRKVLRAAHVQDMHACIDRIVSKMLEGRRNQLKAMCQEHIFNVFDLLFNSRHLKMLDVIRDQRIETLQHRRASLIQGNRFLLSMMLLCCLCSNMCSLCHCFTLIVFTQKYGLRVFEKPKDLNSGCTNITNLEPMVAWVSKNYFVAAVFVYKEHVHWTVPQC